MWRYNVERRSESYRYFLEERDYELALLKKIESATIEELAMFLISSSEEERWIAKWRMEKIGALKEKI